jgi:hypothetical protein
VRDGRGGDRRGRSADAHSCEKVSTWSILSQNEALLLADWQSPYCNSCVASQSTFSRCHLSRRRTMTKVTPSLTPFQLPTPLQTSVPPRPSCDGRRSCFIVNRCPRSRSSNRHSNRRFSGAKVVCRYIEFALC